MQFQSFLTACACCTHYLRSAKARFQRGGWRQKDSMKMAFFHRQPGKVGFQHVAKRSPLSKRTRTLGHYHTEPHADAPPEANNVRTKTPSLQHPPAHIEWWSPVDPTSETRNRGQPLAKAMLQTNDSNAVPPIFPRGVRLTLASATNNSTPWHLQKSYSPSLPPDTGRDPLPCRRARVRSAREIIKAHPWVAP